MKVTEVYWKNLKAYKDGFRVIANKGGSRSSKSWSILQVQNTIAENSKKHRKISLVSHSFPHLRDGLIYDFERFYTNENRDFQSFHNSSSHQIKINKSVINYFSADQSGKVMGPARDILHLNEPNKGITFEHYVQLKARTTECIWIDWNPSGPFWLQNQGIIEDARTCVIHSTFLDNLDNLSAAQIEDFITAKKLSKTSEYWSYYWKVFGLGQDAIMLDERIMPFLYKVSKVPDDAIEIPSGLDFGFFPDPTCFNRLWVRPKSITGKLLDELYIQQIVYDQKLSIDSAGEGANNLCAILEERGVNKNHHIIAESADPRAINDMRMAGYSIEAVKKTSVETSIRKFHEYQIYFVDSPWAPKEEVFTEFDNYRYARDKKTNDILGVPADKQPDHGIDNTRYVIMSRGKRWSV